MQQMAGESEEEYAVRLDMAKQAVQQLTTLVNDMDELLLGWNVDAQTKTTYLDLELTAQSRHEARRPVRRRSSPARRTSPGSCCRRPPSRPVRSARMSDAQVAQIKSGLAALRKRVAKELENQSLAEDEVKLASQLLDDVIDVVEKTVKAKKTDAALALMLDPAAVTILAGATIADGAKLEKTLQQLADEVAEERNKAAGSVTVSAETYQDIHLHVGFAAHAGSAN